MIYKYIILDKLKMTRQIINSITIYSLINDMVEYCCKHSGLQINHMTRHSCFIFLEKNKSCFRCNIKGHQSQGLFM